MAIKLGESVKERGKRFVWKHDYLKSYSTKSLLEKYESLNTIPKVKQKVKNELVRRNALPT
jgi:hypothetical protein